MEYISVLFHFLGSIYRYNAMAYQVLITLQTVPTIHVEKLVKYCRICTKESPAKKLRTISNEIAANIKDVLGIDTRLDDVNRHPLKICESCRLKLKCYLAIKNSRKPGAPPPSRPEGLDFPAHGSNCEICGMSKPDKKQKRSDVDNLEQNKDKLKKKGKSSDVSHNKHTTYAKSKTSSSGDSDKNEQEAVKRPHESEEMHRKRQRLHEVLLQGPYKLQSLQHPITGRHGGKNDKIQVLSQERPHRTQDVGVSECATAPNLMLHDHDHHYSKEMYEQVVELCPSQDVLSRESGQDSERSKKQCAPQSSKSSKSQDAAVPLNISSSISKNTARFIPSTSRPMPPLRPIVFELENATGHRQPRISSSTDGRTAPVSSKTQQPASSDDNIPALQPLLPVPTLSEKTPLSSSPPTNNALDKSQTNQMESSKDPAPHLGLATSVTMSMSQGTKPLTSGRMSSDVNTSQVVVSTSKSHQDAAQRSTPVSSSSQSATAHVTDQSKPQDTITTCTSSTTTPTTTVSAPQNTPGQLQILNATPDTPVPHLVTTSAPQTSPGQLKIPTAPPDAPVQCLATTSASQTTPGQLQILNATPDTPVPHLSTTSSPQTSPGQLQILTATPDAPVPHLVTIKTSENFPSHLMNLGNLSQITNAIMRKINSSGGGQATLVTSMSQNSAPVQFQIPASTSAPRPQINNRGGGQATLVTSMSQNSPVQLQIPASTSAPGPQLITFNTLAVATKVSIDDNSPQNSKAAVTPQSNSSSASQSATESSVDCIGHNSYSVDSIERLLHDRNHRQSIIEKATLNIQIEQFAKDCQNVALLFACRVCHKVPLMPLQGTGGGGNSSCQHVFCWSCAIRFGRFCNVCVKPVRGVLGVLGNLPDQMARVHQNLMVTCNNREIGCTVVLRINEFKAHVVKCPYKNIRLVKQRDGGTRMPKLLHDISNKSTQTMGRQRYSRHKPLTEISRNQARTRIKPVVKFVDEFCAERLENKEEVLFLLMNEYMKQKNDPRKETFVKMWQEKLPERMSPDECLSLRVSSLQSKGNYQLHYMFLQQRGHDVFQSHGAVNKNEERFMPGTVECVIEEGADGAKEDKDEDAEDEDAGPSGDDESKSEEETRSLLSAVLPSLEEERQRVFGKPIEPVDILNGIEQSDDDARHPNCKGVHYPYGESIAKTLEELGDEIDERLKELDLEDNPETFFRVMIKDGVNGTGDVSIHKDKIDNFNATFRYAFAILRVEKVTEEKTDLVYKVDNPNNIRVNRPLLEAVGDTKNSKVISQFLTRPFEEERERLTGRVMKVRGADGKFRRYKLEFSTQSGRSARTSQQMETDREESSVAGSSKSYDARNHFFQTVRDTLGSKGNIMSRLAHMLKILWLYSSPKLLRISKVERRTTVCSVCQFAGHNRQGCPDKPN